MPPRNRVLSQPDHVPEVVNPDGGFNPQRSLLEWYARNRRDLPWRRQPEPYRVLISEVMLQQTQVDRVIPYFERFTEQFPSFDALAAAQRSEVILAWAGLGYNRRAAQLHELAAAVVERHGGQLPADRASLLALPGIGPYTAGALLSIAFGMDEPALDTNVARVVRRYAFDAPPGIAAVREAAHALIPPGQASDWNQALMDLGSSICTGRRPRCLICPLQPGCASAGRVDRGNEVVLGGKREAPYLGSSRYYRGRLLAQLRALPADARASIDEIRSSLSARGVAEPPSGWLAVGQQLERDGLVTCEESPDGASMGLP
jgi:A/G-specific adenine glycosylase